MLQLTGNHIIIIILTIDMLILLMEEQKPILLMMFIFILEINLQNLVLRLFNGLYMTIPTL